MIKTLAVCALALSLVTGITNAYGGENASNPLAAVSNTDLRAQYFDLGGSDRTDYWVDGAYMLTPKLKLKYEFKAVRDSIWQTDP